MKKKMSKIENFRKKRKIHIFVFSQKMLSACISFIILYGNNPKLSSKVIKELPTLVFMITSPTCLKATSDHINNRVDRSTQYLNQHCLDTIGDIRIGCGSKSSVSEQFSVISVPDNQTYACG